jgi:uncharacterized membrane protein
MTFSPLLPVHIAGGIVGLLSGTAALCFRKGSPRHALAGKIFVASMLTMAAAAVYLAVLRHQASNIVGGILTFYLIGTAWLTARRRDGETSRFDWIVLLIPLTLGVLNWMNGLQVVRSGASSQDGVPVGMIFFMGSVMLLAAAGDTRMLVRGGVSGTKRIVRHLWRMCFGLFIAAGSFFLGPSNRPLRLLSAVGIGQHLPSALFGMTMYLILTILPLVLLIFWVFRVWITKMYRTNAVRPQVASSD